MKPSPECMAACRKKLPIVSKRLPTKRAGIQVGIHEIEGYGPFKTRSLRAIVSSKSARKMGLGLDADIPSHAQAHLKIAEQTSPFKDSRISCHYFPGGAI